MGASDVQYYFEVSGYETEFRVVKFGGTESISQLFRYEIYVVAEDDNLPPENIIGQPAVLTIGRGDATRFVSGMVSRFWRIGESDHCFAYCFELVPAIWLLTQRHDCRIFQNLEVPDIIAAVLKEARIPPDLYDLNAVRGQCKVREYCVQYQESDFAFISRLMEEEGIFYFFAHHFESEKRHWKHVMVLGNNPCSHPAIDSGGKEKDPTVVIFKESSGLVPDEECVYEYRGSHQICPEAVTLRDYNYQHPSLELWGHARTPKSSKLEYYTYPGGFDEEGHGKDLAQIRLAEKRTGHEVYAGRSNCIRFLPGRYFTLEGHSHLDQQYLLASVIQAGQQLEVKSDEKWPGLDKLIAKLLGFVPLPAFIPFSPQDIYTNLEKIVAEVFGTGQKYVYTNQFTCIPMSTPFRPQRVTPKPVVHGPQTARVVAEGQEKVHVDQLGRVRVKFHWDRENREDVRRTCDIRVAYNYAGADHGIQFPPLAGDEVVVSFLEGDPDKPLITGVVYNHLNQPPLKPEEMIENVILTPRQHRLLFSDHKKSITLNTGGGEVIEMIDGEDATDFGRQIEIKTHDDHRMHLCKGARASGIQIQTEQGHKVILVDDPHPAGIKIQDKDQELSIDLNSDSKIIQINNPSGPEIRIECRNGKVTVQGGGVEVVGGQVNVNGSGAVKITSAGQVQVEAPSIQATASGSLKLSAPDITLEGATINLNAPMVSVLNLLQCKGVVQTPALVATSVVASSYTPGAGNVM
jgi:Rhs element Vgr protein